MCPEAILCLVHSAPVKAPSLRDWALNILSDTMPQSRKGATFGGAKVWPGSPRSPSERNLDHSPSRQPRCPVPSETASSVGGGGATLLCAEASVPFVKARASQLGPSLSSFLGSCISCLLESLRLCLWLLVLSVVLRRQRAGRGKTPPSLGRS